mmetsp:Transcript_45890/g.87591  ORF Transcript_45890/g.87591 Transcript_45890/m.87591 type:complete len:318 (-) Transcript_45890:413-1366(-)
MTESSPIDQFAVHMPLLAHYMTNVATLCALRLSTRGTNHVILILLALSGGSPHWALLCIDVPTLSRLEYLLDTIPIVVWAGMDPFRGCPFDTSQHGAPSVHRGLVYGLGVWKYAPKQQSVPHARLHCDASLPTRGHVQTSALRVDPVVGVGEHRLPSLLHVTEVHQHCGHALSPVVKEMLHGANPPPQPQVHAQPQTRTQARGHSQISHDLRAASLDFSGVQRIETKGKKCSIVTGNTKQCLCWRRWSIFYDARFLHNRTTNTIGPWRATRPTRCLDLIYGGSDDIHGNENNTFRPPAQPAVCSHLQQRAMPLPVAR